MVKRSLVVTGIAAATMLLAACSSSSSTPSGGGSSGGGGTKSIGVILPDASTSPRWENQDRPDLTAAITAAGYTPIIQNATKSVDKFAQLCDGMINQGVSVLMIVNLNSPSGAACETSAKNAGIPTIDYDRLTVGGSADYYVSFDNVEVGKLMGQGLVDCLTAQGKTKANVVYIDGDPTDNNAKLFKQGYDEVIQAKVTAGDYKLVGDQTGKWNVDVAQTAFEQLYTQNSGKIDGVVSANDTMAGGIITALNNNKLAGKVPVTGQDASTEGLQRIIAGTQCGTVFKNFDLEAKAAADIAIALAKNDGTADGLATSTLQDGSRSVKTAFSTPIWVTQTNIKVPFEAKAATIANVCTTVYAAQCAKLGLS